MFLSSFCLLIPPVSSENGQANEKKKKKEIDSRDDVDKSRLVIDIVLESMVESLCRPCGA